MKEFIENKINELLQRCDKCTDKDIYKVQANLWKIGTWMWCENVTVQEILKELAVVENYLKERGY